MGQTALLPLRRKVCYKKDIFFRSEKSNGFEPANLGTKGQHATSRPLKPLRYLIIIATIYLQKIYVISTSKS